MMPSSDAHEIPELSAIDENTDAWKRWQLTSFDAPKVDPDQAAAETQAKVQAAKAALAEEITRLRQQATTEGRAAGHAEGHTLGYAEGQHQVRMEAAQLAAVLARLDEAMTAFNQQVADDLLALSLEIARQVIRHTIELQPERLLDSVREALALSHHTHAVVSVHPEDAALIRRHADDLLASGGGGHRLREDSHLSRGGCLIEVGGGQIDATLETRWRRVVETLGSDTLWQPVDTDKPHV